MSDAWDEIQAIKSKRNVFRERLEKRKKERQDILGTTSSNSVTLSSVTPANIKSTATSGTSVEAKPECNEIFTTVDNGLLICNKLWRNSKLIFCPQRSTRIRSRN